MKKQTVGSVAALVVASTALIISIVSTVVRETPRKPAVESRPVERWVEIISVDADTGSRPVTVLRLEHDDSRLCWNGNLGKPGSRFVVWQSTPNTFHLQKP